MKPPPFELHVPSKVTEAVALLGQYDSAKLLAGGQSLMAMLNLRYIYPDHLVDVNRIPELTYTNVGEDVVRFGAITRQHAIERSEAVHRRIPILRAALEQVGHRPTRNRGTIGGSLSHLDPAAELPAIALLHDAEIKVAGGGGERVISMAEFMLDFMTPSLSPDELVVEVALPTWKPGHGYAFLEVARRHGDFAIASAAVLLTARSGLIDRVAIVVGGVDILPRRLSAAEAGLIGQNGTDDAFVAAASHVAELHSPGDVHFTPQHRRHLAKTLVRKALAAAYARVAA